MRRYGSHLVAIQPELGLVAYAGHTAVVVACMRRRQVLRTLAQGFSR